MKTTRIIPLEKPIDAAVSIPGSKSYTNRALLMAALVGKNVRIKNPLFSDDTKAMIDCLQTLGIKVAPKVDSLEVVGDITSVDDTSYDLNAHLSGTTIRFILALSSVVAGVKTIRGEGRLNERPIGDLVDALRQLGAKIEYLEKEGFPPLRISSSKLTPGNITMNGSVSSQFLSSILMIAPMIGEVNIEVIGEQISKPYIDMTIDSMKQFGANVEIKNSSTYTVPAGQKYNINEYVVEGDASSASYFFAIAALTQSRVMLKNMNPKSVQADMGFLKILADMGNEVEYGDNEITIQGRGIKPVDVNMQDCPDQVQTLASLSACVPGITHIAGVGSLRVKETERVAALERELAKMGIRSESTPDTMTIYGGYPKPAVIDTYWDHRMAMAFAVLGTKMKGMEIRNPQVVTKTFPDFWEKLNAIGIRTETSERDPNIVLIGMPGSGKTTVARLLAKRLGKRCEDIDSLVAKKAGMSIKEIVEKFGWDHFRDLESDMVREVSEQNGAVISTGGGIITRSENIETVKKNGLCIFLRATLRILLQRMEEDDSHRPAVTTATTPQEEMEKRLADRVGLYEAAADETIDTENAPPEHAVEQIVAKLQERGVVGK